MLIVNPAVNCSKCGEVKNCRWIQEGVWKCVECFSGVRHTLTAQGIAWLLKNGTDADRASITKACNEYQGLIENFVQWVELSRPEMDNVLFDLYRKAAALTQVG